MNAQRLRALPILALCLLACLAACLATCLATCLAAGTPALAAQPAHPAQASAPTETAVILARLPHDAQAFTQGLQLSHGVLFESTGLYGQSSLRRVDPATGRVLARVGLPRKLFGEGLALCPQPETGGRPRLLQLTWREGLILAYDPESLRLLSRHRLRGQGWGLACTGAELALSDGTATLRFLDARTLAETGRTLRVRDGGQPVDRLNELEWVNGWLLANVWQEDRIAIIRPDTGQVALWLDLSPLRRELSELSWQAGQAGQAALADQDTQAEAANGIAFDPKADHGRGALLLTGKRWDTVFVTALPERMRRPPEASGGQPSPQTPPASAKPR